MNFADFKSITIPEGEVVKISSGGVVLWERASAMPSAYQQVEWVEAGMNIGAYIDLGIKYSEGATVKIQIMADGNYSQCYAFGAAENSGKTRFMISAPYSNAYKAYCYFTRGGNYASLVSTLQNGCNLLKFSIKNGTSRAENLTDGYTGTLTADTYSMTAPLLLFAQHYNGSPRFGGARRIGTFEYYDKDDVLICSLLPCYRKSDGVIGMYDTVRQQFLTNVGSGSFTKGADV